MKTFIKSFVLIFCFVLVSLHTYGQIPNGINYQAIARDANGNELKNQNVTLRFSVHSNLSSPTLIYQESQSATSNGFGLVTCVIGTGVPTIGTFSSILWADSLKSLQVEMDPKGGTSYSINMGVQALQTVPYAYAARYALNSQWLTNDTTGGYADTTIYLGTKYQGVGIGTTSPSYPLHIYTNSYYSYNAFQIDGTQSGYTGMTINNSSTGYPYYQYSNTNTNQYVYHYMNNTGSWILNTGGYDNLTVTPSGKTIIDSLQMTTNPSTGAVLTSDVNGNASWTSGVGFYVYPSSGNAQNINPFSYTNFTFDQESFDDGNNVSSGVFTAPTNGAYYFSATVMGNGFTAGTEFQLYFYVNSGNYTSSHYITPTSTTAYYSNTISTVLKLNAGQTVSVASYYTGSTTVPVYVADGAGIYTFFMGYKIY